MLYSQCWQEHALQLVELIPETAVIPADDASYSRYSGA